MKALFLGIAFTIATFAAKAQDANVNSAITAQQEAVKMQLYNSNAYYQKVVKVDSSIKVSDIYLRTLQFMAAKNFSQTYGYEQEGKMIFTTTQDLNANSNFSSIDEDSPGPFTTQFAITLDLKNGRYRYTIHNIIFYIPTDGGNRRQTLFDMHQITLDKHSRRIWSATNNMITAFEKYISTLTNQLYEDIENKSPVHDPKF